MHQSKWSPSVVPGYDQSIYLVVDDFGRHGRCWRETDIEATDLETIITDLLDGQYNSLARVVGFNPVEGWSRDEDVADEIRRRCDLQMTGVPANLQEFVEQHEVRVDRRQLRLV
jgi:hypothetical protein